MVIVIITVSFYIYEQNSQFRCKDTVIFLIYKEVRYCFCP